MDVIKSKDKIEIKDNGITIFVVTQLNYISSAAGRYSRSVQLSTAIFILKKLEEMKKNKPFVCKDCLKQTKEYRDNLCEPCHKWHTDS